jgi:hypothetical protein
MTRKVQIGLHLIASAMQMLVDPLPIAHEWKPFLHAFGAFAQMAIGIIGHAYTPDGEKIGAAK